MEIQTKANQEFLRRDFAQAYIDELSLEFERQTEPVINHDLKPIEKFLIILIPFFVPIQSIIANRHIGQGSKYKWNQHWKYMAFGYVFWIFLIIVFSKKILFSN